MKDGYKLELQTPEKMKLFGTQKTNRENKKRRKYTKSWNSCSSFSPYSLVDNEYQQKSEVCSYTFTANKSYGYFFKCWTK